MPPPRDTAIQIELYSNKVCTRLCRTIKILGITIHTFIQILLEGIKDILHTSIDLQLQMVIQHKGVIQLQVEIHKVRGMFQAVFLDVSGKVRNNHASRIYSGKRKVKVLQRGRTEGKVSIVVRRTRHALDSCHIFIFAPSHRFRVTAALYRKT